MPADQYINANNEVKHRDAEGAGTSADPYRFGFFAPAINTALATLQTAVNTIVGALPPARGTATAGNSLSVVSATDRPFDVRPSPQYGTNTLAVTTALSTGQFLTLDKMGRFRFQVKNTGATALNAFEISTRPHVNADMQVEANTGTQFTAPAAGSIIKSCRDLNGNALSPLTLVAGASVIIALDLTTYFVEAIRIRASVASGTTNIDLTWGGSM